MTDFTRTGNPLFDAWMDAGRRFLEPAAQASPSDDGRRWDIRRRCPRPGDLGALPAPGCGLGEGFEPAITGRRR